MTKRETAMKWWNELSLGEQENLWVEYERKEFTPSNSSKGLTGREIERIYNSIKH